MEGGGTGALETDRALTGTKEDATYREKENKSTLACAGSTDTVEVFQAVGKGKGTETATNTGDSMMNLAALAEENQPVLEAIWFNTRTRE